MEQTLLDSIPSLDLADFTSGDDARKNKFVQDLGAAFNTIGFVAIKNHGLSDELREKFFSENEWKNLKIKVTAKSSYGIFCGGDSGIEKKVLIWRPIVVTLVN